MIDFDKIPNEWKQSLSDAEKALLNDASSVIISNSSENIDDPQNGSNWGPERTIRAELLYWLCTNNQSQFIDSRYGVRIKGAKITGKLNFNWALLPYQLWLINCFMEDTIFLMDAEAPEINFSGSKIHSLHADRLTVKSSLRLDNIVARHDVRLPNANIGGQLSCKDAIFENPDGDAFIADGITTKGQVFLQGIKVRGGARFSKAVIGGQLVCNDARFDHPNADAFNAGGITVKGEVFMRDVTAIGEVNFSGANLDAQFECHGTTFSNPEGIAFNADGLVVRRSLYFLQSTKGQHAIVQGAVRLTGANIGQLECSGAEFGSSEHHAFIAENLIVNSALILRGAKFTGGLNLAHARVGQLADDEASWPKADKLIIDGFEYKALAGNVMPPLQQRLRWINLQPKYSYSFQPYEHLAKLYRQMGHESDARTVLYKKHEAIRKYGVLSPGAKVVNWFLSRTIGHGYRPLRLIIIIVSLIMLGTGLFEWANNLGVMQPSKERVYSNDMVKNNSDSPSRDPQFNALVYSAETFIPFLDLHQKSNWLPDSTKPVGTLWYCHPYGYWFQWYFWLHIVFGWLCSTLVAVYVANLVRKG